LGVVSVSEDVFETPPNVAVITAAVLLATVDVVTVNFAVDDPAATATDVGTLAYVLLLDSEMVVLASTAPLSVTVHEEVVGGVMLVGVQTRLESVGTAGVKVSEDVFETPPNVAVITAAVPLVTVDVVTVNFAVDDPAATATVVGTLAYVLLLDSEMVVLASTAPLSVTVHEEVVGGVMLVGVQTRLESVGTAG
jgi:hypothetical protein